MRSDAGGAYHVPADASTRHGNAFEAAKGDALADVRRNAWEEKYFDGVPGGDEKKS